MTDNRIPVYIRFDRQPIQPRRRWSDLSAATLFLVALTAFTVAWNWRAVWAYLAG